MTVLNTTHLYFEHRLTTDDSVVDYVYVIKNFNTTEDKHTPIWFWVLIGILVLIVLVGLGFVVYWRY